MLNRSDLLELTRRMNVSRSSLDRAAGCYFDARGEFDGSFNIHFLKLSPEERAQILRLVKEIPFAETNRQLREADFPGETRESGDMMRMLDTLKETGLKNDAMAETFCEVAAERLAAGSLRGRPFGIFLVHGVYDIPRIGTDKAEQWESEDVYEYLICAVAPISADYEPGEALTGFLYPSFKDREPDWFHIALFEKEPGVSGREMKALLGCGSE